MRVTTGVAHPGQGSSAACAVPEVRKGRSITAVIVDLGQDGGLLITSPLTPLPERSGVEGNAP